MLPISVLPPPWQIRYSLKVVIEKYCLQENLLSTHSRELVEEIRFRRHFYREDKGASVEIRVNRTSKLLVPQRPPYEIRTKGATKGSCTQNLKALNYSQKLCRWACWWYPLPHDLTISPRWRFYSKSSPSGRKGNATNLLSCHPLDTQRTTIGQALVRWSPITPTEKMAIELRRLAKSRDINHHHESLHKQSDQHHVASLTFHP